MHTRMDEAGGELLIFRAPAAHGFVITVHSLKIGAPEGLIAALDGDEGVGGAAYEVSGERRMHGVRTALETQT